MYADRLETVPIIYNIYSIGYSILLLIILFCTMELLEKNNFQIVMKHNSEYS